MNRVMACMPSRLFIRNLFRKGPYMTRTSRQSSTPKQNFLAASALTPKKSSRGLSLQEQILETKLRSEQAKLAALEAELPNPDAQKYMRYEDMPPPTPEQEAEFQRKFRGIVKSIVSKPYGPDAGQTVQDWLRNMGATIPDTPEWQTPLYLNKFVRV